MPLYSDIYSCIYTYIFIRTHASMVYIYTSELDAINARNCRCVGNDPTTTLRNINYATTLSSVVMTIHTVTVKTKTPPTPSLKPTSTSLSISSLTYLLSLDPLPPPAKCRKTI